jgi:tetratricopeptide (TPR) repeat protein
MPPEPARVEKVFAEVIAKTNPADRADALNRLCGEEIELRQRVEALLAAHEAAGSFLPLPIEAAASESPGPTKPVGEPAAGAGDFIAGRYHLLTRIGEGGMGEVWVAKQTEPVNRKVALKLIKPGMDSKTVLARFEQERHALALMDHPSIARVFDGGMTADGRPFFVMELVNGLPLTKFCDEAKLNPRQRLDLFVPVCQAVQHAHQKGIVHRDLKPSNVLVTLYDSTPVPKVIDFGLAKAIGGKLTNESLSTQFGSVLGTLEYMAPEQAGFSALDVDTRADIYALGVILYELLTGLRPFDSQRMRQAAMDEVFRILREEEPPRPSTRLSTNESLPSLAAVRQTEPKRLTAMMRGELDWVVMKCLEKDRNRRYETASSLARDVQRYLTDEAVEARPPSPGYRLRKLLHKHRAGVLTAATLLALLVSGVVGSTWQAVRATRAETAALAAWDGEAAQRQEAERQKREVEQQRDRAVKAEVEAREQERKAAAAEAAARREADKARTINQFLIEDLLTQAEPERNAPADHVTLLEVVDRAAGKVGERFRGQPLLEAPLQATLGDVYHGLGEFAKAERHWSAALALRRELGAEDWETYRAMAQLGHMLTHRDLLEEGTRLLQDGATGLTRVLGADHPDTLKANAFLADAFRDLERHEEALPLCEQTFEKRKAVLGSDHVDTLMSMKCLADAYLAAGKPDKALPLAEQTLERATATLGPDHHHTLLSMGTVVSAYHAVDKLDKALPLAEQTLDMYKARFGPEHPRTLGMMCILADVYKTAGRIPEAIRLYEQAREQKTKKLGPDHPATLITMSALGVLYWEQAQYDLAEPLFNEVLAIRTAKFGPEHLATLLAKHNLASLYRKQGKYDLAESLFKDVLTIRKANLGPDHPLTLAAMDHRAYAYWDAGQLDKAIPLLEQTLRTREAKLGADHSETLDALNSLGFAYWNARQPDKALPLVELMLERTKARFGPDDPRTLSSMDNLAGAYRETGRSAEAIRLYEQVREQREWKVGPDHPDTLTTMHNLAVAYRLDGRLPESLSLFEHTLKLREAKLGPDHAETLNTMNSLAVACWTAGQLDKSIPLFEESLRRERAKLGDDQPGTISTAFNLAVNYRDAQRLDEALRLFDEWLARSRQTLGPDHEQTHYGLFSLAATYTEAKEFDQALPLYRELLAAQSRNLPADSPDRARTLGSVGRCLLKAGKPAEAERVLRECLAIREKKTPEDWRTFIEKSVLGGALLSQKQYAEAEKLLLSGYAGLKKHEAKIPAPARREHLEEALDWLIQLATATNRADEAANWQVERANLSAAPTSLKD